MLYNSFYGTTKVRTIEYVNGAWTTVDNRTWGLPQTERRSEMDVRAYRMTTVGRCAPTPPPAHSATTTSASQALSPQDSMSGCRWATVNRLCLILRNKPALPAGAGDRRQPMVMVGGEQTVRNQDDSYNSKSLQPLGIQESRTADSVYVYNRHVDPTDATVGRQDVRHRLCRRLSSGSAHGTCATSTPAALPG